MKYYRKRRNPKEPFFIALLVILSILLVWFFFSNRKQERQQTERLRALQNEAAPYEQEIRNIQSDLQSRKNMINASSDVSGAIPCFIPASEDDLSIIKKLSASHAFTPSIVLDCSRDEEELKPIAKAAVTENFSILLTSSSFREDTLDTADSLKKAIAEYGSSYEPAFLLFRTDDSETNRTMLSERGYQNLFLYSDSLTGGNLDDMLYLPYGFFRSTTSGSDLANTLVSAHTSMAVLFDLSAAASSGSQLTEQTIANCLDRFDERIRSNELEYQDISTAFAILANRQDMADRAQEEYDSYAKAQELRIEKLRSTINELYRSWNAN